MFLMLVLLLLACYKKSLHVTQIYDLAFIFSFILFYLLIRYMSQIKKINITELKN